MPGGEYEQYEESIRPFMVGPFQNSPAGRLCMHEIPRA